MLKSQIIITCGLGFGDEGKGSTVDYLVRQAGASAVIRYNGGPQAAHYVVTPDGSEHCFSQFGSGSLVPGVLTHLSQYMFIKPQNIIAEEEELRRKEIHDGFERLSIDPECHIVTPFHAMIGQMLELSRGTARHGSVGMGVGQAALDREISLRKALKISTLFDRKSMKARLLEHRKEKTAMAVDILRKTWSLEMEDIYDRYQSGSIIDQLLDDYSRFAHELPISFVPDRERVRQLLAEKRKMVFEGSQGALIDGNLGFWPYVTKTDTTVKAADGLITPFKNSINLEKAGIMRSYNYRHGPGPLVSEDAELREKLPELHNKCSRWQGDIRVGWLDLLSIRYGLSINPGIDWVVLTHVDKLSLLENIRICISYEYCGGKRELLDRYFVWEGFDNDRIRITAIRPVRNNRTNERTVMMFDCKPLDFLEFTGSPQDTGKATTFEELPERIRNYVQFLESAEGLAMPVGIISVGPAHSHKIFRDRQKQ